ncbi:MULTISPECIES: group II intron reverse transcriptase/maturase [unclassified Nostoc]|uniref:group II intron reverse transcriptase/maturase n=1 Tax=unclassified Nostoc TaxID=2593658 RepID=UPI001CB977CB|nr:group II intron reverse transcriptase/maturase [Nostoc sp. 'Peltigera membranacea cyanobiont' 232]
MSKTLRLQMVEWNTIPWRKLERNVFKLQKRIFLASNRGDTKVVRRLQKTLMRSWSGKALSVRKVTQDNQGKKTAGVDGVKSLTPKARLTLVLSLKLNQKVSATRRVWIPKPGTVDKRPLGIPTMHDRATQALVKLALEPEWEAHFEPNSYGFRPGRSAHDAVEAIFNSINKSNKWVLDADISKCFDKINHEKLLNKINTFPTMRRVIKAWLKAGVMDNRQLSDTNVGTPQGGVLSPLLANIALHGMEELVKEYATQLPGEKSKNQSAISLIRYADDFVILAPKAIQIIEVQEKLKSWLANMGLELSPSKTRISHTLEIPNEKYKREMPMRFSFDINLGKTHRSPETKFASEVGFDFLGFNVRQYEVGWNKSGKTAHGEKLGFKTLIKPSKKAKKIHYDALAEIIDAHKSAPIEALIMRLNPVIRGWVNYYSTSVSKETFSTLDNMVYQKLSRWAKRRHPGKSHAWIASKYWHPVGGDNWVFSVTRDGLVTMPLTRHSHKKIVRHVKVKGTASPFDGNLKYWSSRKGSNPLVPTRVATLLKKQQGKCAHCELYFREDDLIEVDHIIPKSKDGLDTYANLQALHRHCHDSKTANDNPNARLSKLAEDEGSQ